METLSEKIARRAYEKFVQRGGTHGYNLQDWLDAEKEIMQEEKTGIKKSASPANALAKPKKTALKKK